MIEIDGSYGEGGGQIVRTALALSAITKKPFRMNNIRAGRDKPGLKAEHLNCVNALKELCDAKVEGAELGSQEITFIPGDLKSRNLDVDIGTAGSITLLLQSVLLPACLAGDLRIRVKGGTDVAWSIPIDFFKFVILPQYRRFAEIHIKIIKRGYYPKGQGEVELTIKERRNLIKPFDLLVQGNLLHIKGISHAAKELMNAEVADRQAKSAKMELKKQCDISAEYADAMSMGSGICIFASFGNPEMDDTNPVILGADSLGEKGKIAEKVGKECAEKLLKEMNSGACCDEHCTDNIIPLLGLAKGGIRASKISNHALTNIHICEMFLDVKYEINGKERILEVK